MADPENGGWNGLPASSTYWFPLCRLSCRNPNEKQDNMARRFITIWFRHLTTDWLAIRRTILQQIPFVLAEEVHGRKVITAANALAQAQGIDSGMVVADARAILPSLEVLDDSPERAEKLLT